MSKTKKRIKPTREQAQNFNRELDAFIESGYKHRLNCNCRLCRVLAEQAKLIECKKVIKQHTRRTRDE